MKLLWQIEDTDIAEVKAFYEEYKRNELVSQRREANVEGNWQGFSPPKFWKAMTSCLLTTQQRSGPMSAVTREKAIKKDSLTYNTVHNRKNK